GPQGHQDDSDPTEPLHGFSLSVASCTGKERGDDRLIQENSLGVTISAVLELDVAGAVQQAAAGEAAGWDFLVEHYSGMVWSVARGHGLSAADSADVSQTTWLRLAEHLGRLRQPERVGGWLATTARHEAKRVVRRGQRLATVAPRGLETLRVHRV